jgi:hypothetical protein
MTNLRDHIIEWLESIGADGMMSPADYGVPETAIVKLSDSQWRTVWLDLVPAFRHADGTWHVEPELTKPCDSCWKEDCISEMAESCQVYLKWKKRWLAHKEAAK